MTLPIAALQSARTELFGQLRDSIATINAIEDRYPGEAMEIATIAISRVSRHNDVVKAMVDAYGPAYRTLEFPAPETLPLMLALGRAQANAVKDIVKSMGGRFTGSVYKIDRGDGASRGLDLLQTPAMDSTRMSATAIICTPATDREGEAILPDGIDFETRYRLNPVVLWEHGFDPAIPMPIASSEDPATGELSLRATPKELVATSYFTNRVKESEQVYALIDEGIVRATSVRVDPTPGTERLETRDGNRVLVMPKSTLVEWSWGCMGVNPETVRKTLDRNSLAGSRISQPLQRVLKRHAAVARSEAKSR